jgi:lysophospholipase L1-like esterase
LALGALRIANNACFPGETSEQIVARFGRDVEPYARDVVMMEFGTNDAAAANPIVAAYRVAIRKSRALASDPYVWVCATYPHYANLAAGAATRDAIQNLVTTEFGNDPKVIYIDLYTPLLDPSTPGTVPNTYFGDVHTNRRGVSAIPRAHRAAPKRRNAAYLGIPTDA